MIYGLKYGFQMVVFAKGTGIGFILGIIYSLFMIFRYYIKHSVIAVAIEDIVFFVLSAYAVFIFILEVNFGIVRAYIICSVVFGGIFNYFVYGRNIVKILKKCKKKVA